MRRLLLAALACAPLSCTLAPRFDGATQAALARTEMRRMETPSLHLYYPAGKKEEALRVAGRVEACVAQLRARAPHHGAGPDRPITLIMPEAALNNAYVLPPAGGEPASVVPTFDSTDVFTLFGLPPDPSAIACHEVVHYVHALQIAGFPAFVDAVLGDAYSPQIGLDAWFWEGLAVYYETRFQAGIGRLASRYWDGVFEAGMATQGLDGGDLHEANRRSTYGMHYLVGSHFIDWLVKTYGEDKLWGVIKSQSSSFFFPFGVNLRFKGVYGKPLSTLIDEFEAEVRSHPKRARKPEQKVVRALGTSARIARGKDGTEAIVDASWDVPTRLSVFGPDGKLRVQRNLVDVVPPRTVIAARPDAVSGLSVSSDGKFVVFVLLDVGDVETRSRLLRLHVDSGELEVLADDLRGAGGSLTPDDRAYVFSRAKGDAWLLAKLDLDTRALTTFDPHQPRKYVLDAQVAPDGKRVLATTWDGWGDHRLELFDLATGASRGILPGPEGARFEGRFVDDDRVTFVGAHEGRFQVFVLDLRTWAHRVVSDAPYLAWAPRPHGSTVRFLSREGWTWSEDAIALPPPSTTSSEDAPPPYDYPPAPDTFAAAPKSHAAQNAFEVGTAKVEPTSDAPYSHLDGFFRPQVRGPYLFVDANATSYGVQAIGADRLSFHRWLLAGAIDPAHRLFSGAFGWLESSAAPWYFTATASSTARFGRIVDDADREIATSVTRETNAALEVARDFFGSSILARMQALVWSKAWSPSVAPARMLRFVGPTVAARYVGVESTPYTGARRAFALTGSASYYPEYAGSASFSLADLRSESTIVLPVPPSKRLTFHLDGFVRRLVGTSLELLQVGGGGATFARAGELELAGADPRALLPPALVLAEDVRGFEDLGILSRGAAGGEVFLRYPIIVDWGSASTLWLLPSLFFRQLELEVFGSAASPLDGRRNLLAAGASVAMRLYLWRLPLVVRAQLARRFTYDERWSASLFIGADL